MSNNERIQKLISQAGVMSRRKAEEAIAAGRVKVNGKKAGIGQKASFNDSITIDGASITKQAHVYYIMNKPTKTITALSDDRGRKTVIDIMDIREYVFPIGRLDYDTTGVLLLTNDGDLANKLMHPSSEVIRIYRARLKEPLSKQELDFLNSDKVLLDNEKTTQRVEQVDTKTYLVSLHQGKYHHVKRLFELVNNKVLNLHRVDYGGIKVENMIKGSFRKLKPKEVKLLKQY